MTSVPVYSTARLRIEKAINRDAAHQVEILNQKTGDEELGTG
jgi:hypothetical protein